MNDNCEDEHALRKLALWHGIDRTTLRKKVFRNATRGTVSALEKDAAVELVAACLHPDPAQRPQSIAEIRQLTYFRRHEVGNVHAMLLFVSTPGKGFNPATGTRRGWTLDETLRLHVSGYYR